MKNDLTLKPMQPYIMLEADNLYTVGSMDMGISHFYEFELNQDSTHKTKAVPDGSVDLLFNLGRNKVTTYISGTVFGVKSWELGSNDRCFGVRFQPGKGILPDELSMEMLVDNDLEIDGDIFGENITEKIVMAKDIYERSKIFKEAYEELVFSRISLSDKERISDYLVSRITRAKGQVTIQQLEEETNYSACYLRRIFKSYHGISPKQFAQYIRFQNLLEQINKDDIRFDDIALECGYYDEAHMMREFKNYTGKTMEQYQHIMKGRI